MSETRTVQEALRHNAAILQTTPIPDGEELLRLNNAKAKGLHRMASRCLEAADRIDALEKATRDLRNLISSSASKNGLVAFMGNADQVRAIDALLARAALHPSENDAQVAGPMK